MSYSPVFSQSFIEYTDATGNLTFEVPTGFTAVVRDVTLYTLAGGAGLRTFIEGAGSGAPLYFSALESVGLNTSSQWTGRVVALEGYTIGIDVASLGVSDCAYVGGYLLRNYLT